MSISIDRVYQTVLMLANSDIRGNVKPRDLRLAINDVIGEIYEEYFSEISRLTNRQNRGLINSGVENIPDRIREKLLHFLVEDVELVYTAPYFILPADHRYSDNAQYLEADFEFAKNRKHFNIIKNDADAKPTTALPICLRVGKKLSVAPSTIVSDVTISYLRNQIMPNWTFNVINGAEVFDPSKNDFRDIDMHPSEENNVVLRTLNRFGINLKENDIIAVTEGKINQDFNQDNSM